MRYRGSIVVLAASVGLCVSLAAQQPAPPQGQGGQGAAPAQGRGAGRGRGGTPTPQGQNPNGMHIYIRAGLKSHGEGQHDYPQFLADWSKTLTNRGAVVDGALHFPSAAELANTDVIVMYK